MHHPVGIVTGTCRGAVALPPAFDARSEWAMTREVEAVITALKTEPDAAPGPTPDA